MRLIDEAALADITLGSTVLGSGGGGDPYIGMLLAREAIRRHGPVPLVDLDEVPGDANIVFIAGLGAPGVLVEKLPRENEYAGVLRELERFTGQTYSYICPAEAGGFNGVTPFTTSAVTGVPVVDADGMGRAFPELQLVTPTLYGGRATPLTMVDEHGNVMSLESPTNAWSEAYVRAAVVASGAHGAIAVYPMTGAEAKERLIRGPITLAEEIGRAIREARAAHTSPVEAVLAKQGGVLLLTGKVEEVERKNEGGWTVGKARLSGLDDDRGRRMTVDFQNEYLIAERDGRVVATSPDLIMTLEIDSGEPIPAEEIRYGYRVAVVGLPCDPHWRTEAGIEIAGPRHFGYDIDYRPVEETAGDVRA
ncbi:DUF917 domain-containing protein [Sinosporangium siamense]|uniref:DUF917 domain-containing protein n=1 Tax=Sinosporangium siamense TaxID=1367973 RepID=A0A919RIE0_9ACTN|nr:DUF917 domain-containing protein [Sinosporangium siamense]GII92546.1 hypothetical protein Ssi02_27770 [Sinosporangium siamense]